MGIKGKNRFMPPEKFYAVAKGIKPGIYESWADTKIQVYGFSGALFKSFESKSEAEEWLKENSDKGVLSNKVKANSAGRFSHKPNEILIYTDGASLGNPGPGGYGAVLIYGDNIKELHGGFRLTTNNRMELMGVIAALSSLKSSDYKIIIHTDSKYVVEGIKNGWAALWKRNNWIKSDKKPVMNSDLWKELLDLIEPLDIDFKWVKGHAGNKYNERCDELAVSAAKGKNLSIDKGYE